MQLSYVLGFAALFLGATATPVAEPIAEAVAEHGEFRRGHLSCVFPAQVNYRFKKCVCPFGMTYGGDKRCHFPFIPEPRCKKGQSAYCASSIKDIILYNRNAEECERGEHNVVFCSDKIHFKNDCKKYFPIIGCSHGEIYNPIDRKCECPGNQVFNSHYGKCEYPVLSKITCNKGYSLFCGYDRQHFTLYDANNLLCLNDGRDSVFCARNDRDRHFFEIDIIKVFVTVVEE